MKEGYWVVRTYEAGAVGEKIKFWIPGKRPNGKTKRSEKAEIKKQEQNEYSSQKSLARLLNANFRAGDVLLGLDYSEQGLKKILASVTGTEEWNLADDEQKRELVYKAAEHAMNLYLRRLKRELKKDGIELKAISTTSDMDGDTGELVRVHHHIVVNAEARDKLIEKWKLGGVDIESLSNQGDYTALAEYLLRQVRRRADAKKYTSTRNLIRPQPKDRVAMSDAPLRVPQGGTLIFCAEYRKNAPQYIRYFTGKGSKHKTDGNTHRGGSISGTVRPCAVGKGAVQSKQL